VSYSTDSTAGTGPPLIRTLTALLSWSATTKSGLPSPSTKATRIGVLPGAESTLGATSRLRC